MAVNLGLKIYELVNRFARRLATKPDASGIMQIPNQETVRNLSNEILTKMMKHNVPREMLTTERDIQKILNQIDIIETENLRRRTISPGDPRHKELTDKLLGKKKTTADLIDLGLVRKGKNVKKTTPKEAVDPKLVEEVKVQETFDDFNARQDLQNKLAKDKGYQKYRNETEEQIKKRFDKQNKESIKRFKEKMKDKDPEDLAQGGRTGLSYLLAEDTNERMPYAEGNGVYDEEVAKKKFGERVRRLMDEGYDFGEAVREAMKEEGFASGGRVPFKVGGIDKGRRAFLKLMGVAGAGIGALKAGALKLLGKEGATVAKELTQVPIKNIEGMPPWFKPLVNKVIKEGTEVPSGAERVIVHKTKLPESKTDVYVNQDLSTGDVWVDIGIEKHGFASGKYGQPVRLEYKASEVIEPDLKTGKGGGKTSEEFNVEEAEFTGGHPENVKFEESVIEKFGDHASDFSEVEKFAIGKNTIKGQIGGKPTKNPFGDEEMMTWKEVEEAARKGDLPDDYASGGRVPLFKGKIVKGIMSLGKKKKTSAVDEAYKKQLRRLEGYLGSLDRNAPDFQEAANITIKKIEKLQKDYKAGKFVPEGQVIDDTIVVDDDFGSAMAEWARKNDPEGYAKIQKVVDEANQQLELKRFKTKGRKPNASGGLAKMLGE